MATATGGISRRCRCRDKNGNDLGSKCPKLKQRNHGSWKIKHELPLAPDGSRRYFRRSGFKTKDDAVKVYDQLRALLNLAEEDLDDLEKITMMIVSLDRKEPLPAPEEVRIQLRSSQAFDRKGTIGEWLDAWLPQMKHLRRSSRRVYEAQIRLYLQPKIGHLRRDRLNVGHLIEMFASIEDDNDKIQAANADRRALEQGIKETTKRTEKRALREQLAAMPPYRRPVNGTSQQRIRACLRKAINDAIAQQLMTFNAAEHVTIQAKQHKPIVWTAARVEKWRQTGQRPGPVMVWEPKHAGVFLDYVAEHDPGFEAMWHIATFRGPRRGELAGLSWTEVNLDSGTIEITTQLTEVNWEVAEGEVKSAAGERTIPLDDEGVKLLRAHRKRQMKRQFELGDAWVDSGKVFTRPDGSWLRPSWISDQFERLYTAAGLPPIRLHDLRHTAATLMLAAGVDMKVVQETLGHSAIAVTSDTYTSVLPELAKSAAEATASVVPRGRNTTSGHPSGTPRESPDVVLTGGAAFS